MDTRTLGSLNSRIAPLTIASSMKTDFVQKEIIDLDEEVPRMLESVNPLAPRSLVQFNNSSGAFELAPAAPPNILLIHLESSAIPQSSEEALNDPEGNFSALTTVRPSLSRPTLEKEAKPVIDLSGGLDEIDDEDEIDPDNGGSILHASLGLQQRAKKIPNAFNFCETGAQTEWPTYESNGSQTVPVAKAVFEATATPSLIYDAIVEDTLRMQIEKAIAANEPLVDPEPNETSTYISYEQVDLAYRNINQNTYDEITFDFGYFEDKADEFRTTGSLLPLWRFFKPGFSANNLAWNPLYKDLIAVAFGAPDYEAIEEEGLVVLYTLKNPSQPYYSRKTNSGVLSLAFNETYPHLLAVGFYDGHVAVYDTASTDNNAMYRSGYTDSHTRGVSGIKWTGEDDLGDEGFLSISFDGHVKRWVVKKSGLEGTTAMVICFGKGISGPGGMVCTVQGSGYTIQLNPLKEMEYFVGNCTGVIQKYNILHGESIVSLKAHDLPVRRICHNAYMPKVFLSCSEDWDVKLWEDGREDPLMTFDLGNPVIDVAWSPYTSTVFAALTAVGFIHIFDLHMDRHRAICRQGVVSIVENREPTSLIFNPKFPIAVIGDTKGSVVILKLSPNLRIPARPSKKEVLEPWELEVRKLEKILSYNKPQSVHLRTGSQINQV